MSLGLRIRRAFLAFLVLPFWYIQRLIPRDKSKWVFGAWFGNRYSDNSKALFEYILLNEPRIKALWVTRDDALYNEMKMKGLPVAKADSLHGFFSVLRSGVAIITNDYTDIIPQCMNGIFSVWLWHGMPMKQIGKDEERFIKTRYNTYEKIKGKFTDILYPYYRCPHKDVVLSTGEFFDNCLHSSFDVPYERIWNDGLPRNDYFFSNKVETYIKELKEKYPGSRIIVYMPTHRLTAMKGKPFSGFDGFKFDHVKFVSFLEDNNYIFLNKGHFYDSGSDWKFSCDRFINLTDNDYENLYSFLKDIDILITDYSSIYFDFLLTQKPIILTPFDISDYISNERPLYFDYNNLEAIKASDWDEVLMLMNNSVLSSPSLEEINKYHKHIDGLSSKRITNHIIELLGL